MEMTEEIHNLLDKEPEEVKESIENFESDISKVIEIEKDKHAREGLIEWLEEKKERLELLEEEEMLEELMSFLEYSYNTAAISKKSYINAKDAALRLLNS